MWVVACVVGAGVFAFSAAQPGPRAEGSGQYWAVSTDYLSAPDIHFETGAPASGVGFAAGFGTELAYGIRRGRLRWEAIGSFERVAAEGSVFEEIEGADGASVGSINPTNGSASSFAFLAGGAYDFASPWRVFGPFIGGAVGISRANFDVTATTGTTVLGNPVFGLALRGVAGANIHLGPGVDVFVESRYRRFGTFHVYDAGGLIQDAVLDGWGVGAGFRLTK